MSEKKPLSGEVLPPLGRAVTDVDALAALKNMVTATSDFLKIREQERTKRAQIDTYKTLECERIRAAEAVLRRYFEQAFAERDSNFRELLARVDQATDAGDAQAMSQTIGAVVALAQNSPLADLGDLGELRKALDDPDHRWTF